MKLDRPCDPAELAEDLGLIRVNVSNHLACLRVCGVVVKRPEGRWMRYELAGVRLGHASRQLLEVVLTTESDACQAANNGCR